MPIARSAPPRLRFERDQPDRSAELRRVPVFPGALRRGQPEGALPRLERVAEILGAVLTRPAELAANPEATHAGAGWTARTA
ncbi:hypothetical protein [Actinokineospora sp. NBRC 105648]|uniref:hypothetical protein n=1 Tax=Actinokineospora sp. NBRC 105648 TaxID=3032206 RepID=UPI0025554436|nr:hypothetical protein [Actinokineospora sp. NBRC 105648]